MTVKTRITFYVAGAGLIFGLLYSVIVSFELIEQPFMILDSVLKDEAYEAARALSGKDMESKQPLKDSPYHPMGGAWIEIHDRSTGELLFRSQKAESIRLLPVKIGSGAVVRVAVPQEHGKPFAGMGRKVAFRVRSFSYDMDGRTLSVQIARDMEKLHEELRELLFGIVAGLIVSTLVLFAYSHFLAGRILSPIARMKELAQDISERNLEQRIPAGEGRDEFNELARTINRMLDRLQYSFTRQREFLFDTSHELKTPLTTMRLAVDEMSVSETECLPPIARENLLRLKSQVLRMERLIKDLLSLSSLETMTAIDPNPVQMRDLLASLAEDYKFLADARNIEMEIRLPEGLAAQGHGEMLHRAFSNILNNAINYNVDGGRVELVADQAADEMTVSVGNTGPGVAEEEIPKVFDQFYRTEKSRSAEHGGSGLGLAIVKRIVELHGGKVKFESRQGSWTRVTVSLPLRRDPTLHAMKSS